MDKRLDSRLPSTTSYWIDGEIFVIKNTSFNVSQDEGYAISELMMYAMMDQETKGVLIDNREAKGAWSSGLEGLVNNDNHHSNDLPAKKMATLTNSAITTMQVNRLSKNSGMEICSKAFNKDFDEEVKKFLLG